MRKRKYLITFSLITMILFTACGGSGKTGGTPADTACGTPTAAATAETTAASPEAKIEAPAEATDSQNVTIHLTKEEMTAFDTSFEELESDEHFDTVTKAPDGGATITVSKDKHKKLMDELEGVFTESFQEVYKDESFSVEKIEPSADYRTFTVHLKGDKLNDYDSFLASFLFTPLGAMYNAYNGTPADNIHIDYVDPSGNVVSSEDSGNLEDYFKRAGAGEEEEESGEERTADSGAEASLKEQVKIEKEFTISDSLGWYTRHYYVVTNNSDVTVDISTNTMAYDKDQNLVSAADGSFDDLPAGCTVLFYEAFETDAEIDHYEPTFSVKKSSCIPVIQDLELKRTDANKAIIMQVTNNGKENADFVELTAIFYKGGEPIGMETHYFTNDASTLPSGETISGQLKYYDDYDEAEVYISGGRNYSW